MYPAHPSLGNFKLSTLTDGTKHFKTALTILDAFAGGT